LTDVTATASQSFQAVIHNTWYPNPATRPSRPSAAIRLAHWVAGGVLTVLTLALVRGRRGDGPATVVSFGALVVVMLLTSPVCHLHYFCLSLPLVMGLLAAAWEGKRTLAPGAGVTLVLAGNAVANALPHLPALQPLRDGGVAGYAALLLWLAGAVVLWRRARRPAAAARPATRLRPAA
jgi:hypothetical protein